jgi:HEPN domain-containing protein
LVKAQHDLAAAYKLATEPDSYLDTAIYHCQQAGEKAVKAFLVFEQQTVDKTHDIRVLTLQAIVYEPTFNTQLVAAARLTPYATRFRYPGPGLEPSQSEYDQALADAEQIYAFVLALLPPQVHP